MPYVVYHAEAKKMLGDPMVGYERSKFGFVPSWSGKMK